MSKRRESKTHALRSLDVLNEVHSHLQHMASKPEGPEDPEVLRAVALIKSGVIASNSMGSKGLVTEGADGFETNA